MFIQPETNHSGLPFVALDNGGKFPLAPPNPQPILGNGSGYCNLYGGYDDRYYGLGRLFKDYNIDPHVFYCPSDEIVTYHGSHGWKYNDDRVAHNWLGVSYFTRGRDRVGGQMSVYNPSGMAIISDPFTFRVGGPKYYDGPLHRDGFNVGYADGSAQLVKNSGSWMAIPSHHLDWYNQNIVWELMDRD